MELGDPISDKFHTLIEALMVKTTSEIVKVFMDILLETRLEISRSWKKIDELNLKLDQRKGQNEMFVLKNQTTQVVFKREENEVQENPQVDLSVLCTVKPTVMESQNEVQKPDDPANTQNHSAEVHGPVISRSTAAMSDSGSSLNENQEIGARGENKITHPRKSDTEFQMSSASKKTPVVDPQQPSTSTDIIILDKKLTETGAVVTKRTYLQKHISPAKNTRHVLRGRQFRSPRPCLCCPEDQCSDQQNEKKRTTSSVIPRVYNCKYCEKTFQDKTELKEHKCFVCNKCGQSFIDPKDKNTHSQGIQTGLKRVFPYRCYLCSQMFSTLCGWNMHKRIHTHECLTKTTMTSQNSMSSTSPSVILPKELNSMVQVRLERIPHDQLEAALSYKSSPSVSNKNINNSSASQLSSAAETTVSAGSTPAIEAVSNAPQLNKEPEIKSGTENLTEDSEDHSVVSSPSAQVQLIEKISPSKTLTLCRASMINFEENLPGASEERVMGLNSRKRKLAADCSHDMYNGVFPVEKILKWRKKKGQEEVRIKWMPCSLCGAKWKNTWEPSESFISYKDSKKEGPKNKLNQN